MCDVCGVSVGSWRRGIEARARLGELASRSCEAAVHTDVCATWPVCASVKCVDGIEPSGACVCVCACARAVFMCVTLRVFVCIPV